MNASNPHRAVRALVAAASVVVVLSVAAPAWAQHDAVIAGRVVDPQGNPVPRATIIVFSIERGDQRELHANDKGEYIGRGFRPERYRIQVRAEGFAPVEQEVRARLGMNTVDVTLPPATAAMNVDYDRLNSLYDKGYKAYQASDWPAAEAAMNELIPAMAELTGEDAATIRKSAHEMLGRALFEQGKYDEAAAVYETLLEIDPDSLPGHVWAAQTYTKQQQFDKAMPHLVRAAELAPDDAAIQYNAGAILLQLNHVDEGIARIRRAIEIKPEFPLAYKNLGFAYLRAQDYASAIDMLKRYLEQAPDAPDKADIEGMIQALEAQIQQ